MPLSTPDRVLSFGTYSTGVVIREKEKIIAFFEVFLALYYYGLNMVVFLP